MSLKIVARVGRGGTAAVSKALRRVGDLGICYRRCLICLMLLFAFSTILGAYEGEMPSLMEITRDVRESVRCKIVSLESSMVGGDQSFAWDQDAFYVYTGSGNFRVLQVVSGSGILGTGAGLLVFAPQSEDGVAFFIRGKLDGVADGDALPQIRLKLDGTYHYKSLIGLESTLRAFRQLTTKEEKAFEAEIERVNAECESKMETKMNELRSAISKRLEKVSQSYFAEQQKAHDEVECFFSKLDLDIKKNFYIDRTLVGALEIDCRNVYMDDIRQAQAEKNWKRCLELVYTHFYKTGRKPVILQDNVPAKEIFAQLTAYDFVKRGKDGNWSVDGRYEQLLEKEKEGQLNWCLNYANDILHSSVEENDTHAIDHKILVEYPDLWELKEIFNALLNHPFSLDEKVSAKIEYLYEGFSSMWIDEVNNCKATIEDRNKEMGFSSRFPGNYLNHNEKDVEPFFVNYFGDARYDTRKRFGRLRMPCCYIGSWKTWDNIAEGNWGMNCKKEFLKMRSDLAEDKIRVPDYVRNVIDIAKTIEDRVNEQFIRMDKAKAVLNETSQPFGGEASNNENKTSRRRRRQPDFGGEESYNENETNDDTIDFEKCKPAFEESKSQEAVILGWGQTTKGESGGFDVNMTSEEAKVDKAEFRRLWSEIQPENPSDTKIMRGLSRLKQGMENESLRKLYDKYSTDKCADILDQFIDELRSARAIKISEERMAAREKLLDKYKGIFLTGLGQRMDKIIGVDAPQGKSAAPIKGGNGVAAGASSAYQKCVDCDGAKYIKEEAVCDQCNGHGQIEKVKLGLNGTSRRVINKCANCNGNGVATKKTPCATCKGKGKIRIE